ncbi:hypothetical protein Rs2_42312 [Raphanus sativus]|nr:hypothetical protein Rs2_42312 [Raphanus sativus]
MLMRHLASAEEGNAQTALDDASWGLLPPSQLSNSFINVPPSAGGKNSWQLAQTVREVLPHEPNELSFQNRIKVKDGTTIGLIVLSHRTHSQVVGATPVPSLITIFPVNPVRELVPLASYLM